MLSYLIVILGLRKLENTLFLCPTDRHEDSWTQKQRKNLKKPTLADVSAGPPDKEYLYYSLNVKGATQKGSLLPAYIR